MRAEHKNIPPEVRASKFNIEVSRSMEKQFAETGDIRGSFVTHAFPIENLAGIVKEGGMRSGLYLDEKGITRTAGSSNKRGPSGAKEEELCFNKGFISATYSDRHDSAATLLFPTQEYNRCLSLQRDVYGQSPEEKLDSQWTGEGASEVNVHFAPFRNRYLCEATERIWAKKRKLDLKKIHDELQEKTNAAKDEFDRQIQTLTDIKEVVKTAKEAMGEINWQAGFGPGDLNQYLTNSIDDQIKTCQAAIKRIAEQRERARENLTREQNYYDQNKERTDRHMDELAKPHIVERIFGFGRKYRAKQGRRLQQELHQAGEPYLAAIRTMNKLDNQSQKNQRMVEQLGIYKKIASEFIKRIGLALREKELAEEKLEENDARGKIKSRLKKLHGAEETEERMRMDISHGIIFLGSRHVDQAKKILRDKPGLKARTIIFDEKKFRHPEGTFTTDANQAFNQLCMTDDGLRIIKAAQLGVEPEQPSSIEGIYLL